MTFECTYLIIYRSLISSINLVEKYTEMCDGIEKSNYIFSESKFKEMKLCFWFWLFFFSKKKKTICFRLYVFCVWTDTPLDTLRSARILLKMWKSWYYSLEMFSVGKNVCLVVLVVHNGTLSYRHRQRHMPIYHIHIYMLMRHAVVALRCTCGKS